MRENRSDPDLLLKEIEREETMQSRGHLTIFFGYAAGVGKTFSMLKAAHAAKSRGLDVAVGYVEPHARPQTTSLLRGLEVLPVKEIPYNHMILREFDLDAALERKPQLILVDELAHTNAADCRHAKRCQDVNELLNMGIDVYTTVNVQHLESLNDMVASITGVLVRERIPDKVFDGADQVRLVDIEPEELLERLKNGQVYGKQQAKQAASNFFSVENLTALRELALRRCADRINKLTEAARVKTNGDYFTDEHILVCLSSSPSNPKIIRTAARMANAFKGGFTALFVETPDFLMRSEKDKNMLRSNIHLAQQLGATVETVCGEDVAFQISEFSRLSGVSKVVLGRNNARRSSLFGRPALTEKLLAYSPNLDIYIIPDRDAPSYRQKKRESAKNRLLAADFFKSGSVLLAASLVGQSFYLLGFSEANIITVYILGVLVTSLITSRRIYSLVSSVVSVLVFNFLFTEPRFTLNAYDSGYPVTFLVMFTAAFLTGSLAVRTKQSARQAAQAAFRTKILFDTNQLLQQAGGRDEIITVTALQLIKLLEKDIVFYPAEAGGLGEPKVFSAFQDGDSKTAVTENEQAVAAWVMKNNKRAGATTDTLANAKCLYLAVRIKNEVFGVVGLVIAGSPLDSFENSILLSILGECALALENEKTSREKEEAAVLAKNEQLRANLLRSISHDLRTPLTSISGNAGNLLANGESFDEDTKRRLYTDIYDDSLWLINLVENLLSITRIGDGTENLRLSAELIDEVIAEALRHVNRKVEEHTITVKNREEFLLAKMDAWLIVQVIINLVDNAVKYTPKGSAIEIDVSKRDSFVEVRVSDDGPGVADDVKPHIFDMFYTGKNEIGDSRRSLGLGLALCKSIINAHRGEISVSDNYPRGTAFTFTLPAEEVILHE